MRDSRAASLTAAVGRLTAQTVAYTFELGLRLIALDYLPVARQRHVAAHDAPLFIDDPQRALDTKAELKPSSFAARKLGGVGGYHLTSELAA